MDQIMSNLKGLENFPSASLNVKSGFGSLHHQKFHPNGTTNGLGNRDCSMRSLVAPDCSRKFDNLQDYLLEVAKALGQRQSFYSLDLADVLRKVQIWRDALPSVEVFYAVKANPDPVLLKLLVMIGTSFDCATEGEIQAVLKAGASPSSILWAHTVKPVDGLQYARSVGVDAMTFDDEEELKKIHTVFPTARLFLRVRPSMVKCKYDLSKKFGCNRSQAEHLLRLAKQLEMNVQGISFHVGSLCTDPDCFSATIRDCREIFEWVGRIGHRLSVLDIGGGFFGAKGTEPTFKKIAERINAALEEHFSDSKVHVIAEPGCYLTGSCMNLVCTVIGKRNVTEEGGVCKHYFLNNGIYGSFFKDIECYGIRGRPLLTESELRSRAEFESVLYGQTCCPTDIVQRGGRLPDLDIGECLAWENMGAYSSALCSTFCGVPLPVTVYVFDRKEGLKSQDTLMNGTVREFLKKHAVFIGECGSSK